MYIPTFHLNSYNIRSIASIIQESLALAIAFYEECDSAPAYLLLWPPVAAADIS